MDSQIERVGDIANHFIKDGILYCVYLPNSEIDLVKAKLMVEAKLSLCKGNDYPCIVDARFLKSITSEAKTYFTISNEGKACIVSVAILVESNISRMMGNLYLTFNTPTIPSKLFADKEEALRWLSKFKSEVKIN